MAGPALLIPFFSVAARSVGVLLRRWQGVTALIGLVVASGFTFNAMVRQMADTALSLWPLLALACFFCWLKSSSGLGLKCERQKLNEGGKSDQRCY